MGSLTGSMPWREAACPDRGEPVLPDVFAEVGAVEIDVVGAGLGHHVHDRLGDDVARGEVGERMAAGHESAARAVDQEGALAAYGLGDERLPAARARAEPEHGGVELDEFQVRCLSAGAQGEPDAVAGGDRRVRGGGVDLTHAAGGQHHGGRVHGSDAVLLALADHVQREACDAAVVRRAAGQATSRARSRRCRRPHRRPRRLRRARRAALGRPRRRSRHRPRARSCAAGARLPW